MVEQMMVVESIDLDDESITGDFTELPETTFTPDEDEQPVNDNPIGELTEEEERLLDEIDGVDEYDYQIDNTF